MHPSSPTLKCKAICVLSRNNKWGISGKIYSHHVLHFMSHTMWMLQFFRDWLWMTSHPFKRICKWRPINCPLDNALLASYNYPTTWEANFCIRGRIFSKFVFFSKKLQKFNCRLKLLSGDHFGWFICGSNLISNYILYNGNQELKWAKFNTLTTIVYFETRI